MEHLSVGIKYRPQWFENKDPLVVMCEISNCVEFIPLKKRDIKVIGKTLIHGIKYMSSSSKRLIVNKDFTFTGKVIIDMYDRLGT